MYQRRTMAIVVFDMNLVKVFRLLKMI